MAATDLFGNRSTLDTGDRSAFDFYPTPGWMTRSLVHYVPEIAGSRVLKCASGDSAIAEVLREEFGCEVVTNDVDPSQPAQFHLDATLESSWQLLLGASGPFDYIVSNLPFNVGFDILRHAFSLTDADIALLFRKTFLEPTEDRGEWLALHPPSRLIGQPRHKFRAGSEHSDSVSCDWNVWERQPNKHAYPIEIDHLAKSRKRGSV